MSGWIGVDLDGTLAMYDGWVNELHIGKPVPRMVARVKAWIEQGREVRIFTARVCEPGVIIGDKNRSSVADIRAAIEAWCLEHVGQVLPITNVKDFGMIELWDDRCVQVYSNTGIRVDSGEWVDVDRL